MTGDLDAVWKALSDPTRRAILDLLRQGPRTTTEIVDAFRHMTRFGVMKHIDVLREAGLVNTFLYRGKPSCGWIGVLRGALAMV
jgi:DNA-binding transcriptional ArsR family regulator